MPCLGKLMGIWIHSDFARYVMILQRAIIMRTRRAPTEKEMCRSISDSSLVSCSTKGPFVGLKRETLTSFPRQHRALRRGETFRRLCAADGVFTLRALGGLSLPWAAVWRLQDRSWCGVAVLLTMLACLQCANQRSIVGHQRVGGIGLKSSQF